MPLLPAARKLVSERPGAYLVADEVGASKIAREARMIQVLGPPPSGATPDIVALIDGVPLVVRCRVPVCTCYVMQPAVIPSPTIDDHDLALSVAQMFKRGGLL